MTHLVLLPLSMITGLLAYLTARWESRQFFDQKHLDKTALTMVRIFVGMMFVVAVGPKNGMQALMILLLMMGVFGPVHRTTLNLTRIYKYPERNRGLRWYHLGDGWYDALSAPLSSWPKTRFLTLCVVEAAVFVITYNHLYA